MVNERWGGRRWVGESQNQGKNVFSWHYYTSQWVPQTLSKRNALIGFYGANFLGGKAISLWWIFFSAFKCPWLTRGNRFPALPSVVSKHMNMGCHTDTHEHTNTQANSVYKTCVDLYSYCMFVLNVQFYHLNSASGYTDKKASKIMHSRFEIINSAQSTLDKFR